MEVWRAQHAGRGTAATRFPTELQNGRRRGHGAARARAHLQGALYAPSLFFPQIPPSTVSGNVTTTQIRNMITIVPNGSAWVDPWIQATVFRKENTARRGPQKRPAVRSTFCTHWRPPIFLYQTPDT